MRTVDAAYHEHTMISGKGGQTTPSNRREGTMRTMNLNQLSWRSYVTLCTMISTCIGFALGFALVLLVHILHVDFSIHLGTFYIGGSLFSIVSLFIGPFVGAATGFLGSLFTQPLFALILAWFSGVPLTGKWREAERHESSE
jgi:hypothetical protein